MPVEVCSWDEEASVKIRGVLSLSVGERLEYAYSKCSGRARDGELSDGALLVGREHDRQASLRIGQR